jgi:cell division protein FtsX
MKMTAGQWLVSIVGTLMPIVLIVWLWRATRARVKQGMVSQSSVNRARLSALLVWGLLVVAIVVGWLALHGR